MSSLVICFSEMALICKCKSQYRLAYLQLAERHFVISKLVPRQNLNKLISHNLMNWDQSSDSADSFVTVLWGVNAKDSQRSSRWGGWCLDPPPVSTAWWERLEHCSHSCHLHPQHLETPACCHLSTAKTTNSRTPNVCICICVCLCKWVCILRFPG